MDRIENIVLAVVGHDLQAEPRLTFWHRWKLDEVCEHAHRGQTTADQTRERLGAHLDADDGRRIAINVETATLKQVAQQHDVGHHLVAQFRAFVRLHDFEGMRHDRCVGGRHCVRKRVR